MTKAEHALHWQQQALDNWEAVDVLYKGRKYLQSLFWLHLTIEKLSKAVWILTNDSDVPPRTHDLIRLLNEMSPPLPDEYGILFTELN